MLGKFLYTVYACEPQVPFIKLDIWIKLLDLNHMFGSLTLFIYLIFSHMRRNRHGNKSNKNGVSKHRNQNSPI